MTDTGSNPWASYTDTYDAIWQRLSQVGTFDDGRTWRTDWDVAGAQAWSVQAVYQDALDSNDWTSITDRYDDQNRIYERTGVHDEGWEWHELWDLDDTQAWSRNFTLYDNQNDFEFASFVFFYDELDRLYQQTGTFDDGQGWQTLWDVDGTETWTQQYTLYDSQNTLEFVSFTLFYDDQSRIYEQVGTGDDGQQWQTLWDLQGTEAWSWQTTYTDVTNSYVFSHRTDRYDDLGRRYEETGTYDDGVDWNTQWDLDDTEIWARRTVLTDSADAFAWSTLTYEYDAVGTVINFIVVDDSAFV